MYTQNYTRLATIRPVVLSTSSSRYVREAHVRKHSCDFPQGRQTGLTLVLSDCQYKFKVANKDVLFSATNNVDGTVTFKNPAGFLSLTIAGSEVVRLANKADLDIDEIFLTPEELLELHEEPVLNNGKSPTLDHCDDLADFANAHLGSYFGKRQSIISRKLPNGKWQRRGTRHPRPPKRRKPSNGYKRRITRKGPMKRKFDPATYTPAHLQADVTALWG